MRVDCQLILEANHFIYIGESQLGMKSMGCMLIVRSQRTSSCEPKRLNAPLNILTSPQHLVHNNG